MDEVLRMPLDQELLIIRGQKVLKLSKFDYTLHPDSHKLVQCNIEDYCPTWRAALMVENPFQEGEIKEKMWKMTKVKLQN